MTLFIGGPADGKRMDVSDAVRSIVIPAVKNYRERHRYHRCLLSGETKLFEVFVHSELDGDRVMERLINGYAPTVK